MALDTNTLGQVGDLAGAAGAGTVGAIAGGPWGLLVAAAIAADKAIGAGINNGYSSKTGDVLMNLPGLSMIGAGVNRLWGSRRNEENIASAKNLIKGMNTFTSQANSFDSLTKAWTNRPAGTIGKLGTDAPFSNDIENLTADLTNQYNLANQNTLNQLRNNLNNLNTNQYKTGMANFSAYGGKLGGYGADFTNGVTYINNGGTHEQNPYEGVPMGVDQEGTPNLVEEGEAVFNDYVFSNRLTVPKPFRRMYGLGGPKKLSFADAAKKLSAESEERPNDPISKNGLRDSMMKLQAMQELLKQQKQGVNYAANGGKLNKFFIGGDLVPDGVFSGDYINWLLRTGVITAGSDDYNTLLNYINDTEDKTAEFREVFDRLTRWTAGEPSSTLVKFNTSIGKAYREHPKWYPGISWLTPEDLSQSADTPAVPTNVTPDVGSPNPATTTPPQSRGTSEAVSPVVAPAQNTVSTSTNPADSSTSTKTPPPPAQVNPATDHWLRYASALGPALGLGITLGTGPDYSNADALNQLAESYTPNLISTTSNRRYLTYNPIASSAYVNPIINKGLATESNIMNTAAGNRGTALAGLLASNYATTTGIGDAMIKAKTYNDNLRKEVETFNRDSDEKYYDRQLRADLANQSELEHLRTLRNSTKIAAEAERQRERTAYENSISSGLTSLFDNLGTLGQQYVTNSQANFYNKYVANAPRQDYTIDPKTGEVKHNAYGGKIKRKRGLTY